MQTNNFTCAAVWRGNPTVPKCHQMHQKPGGKSQERSCRSSQDCDQDVPGRPQSPLCPWTRPAWLHQSNTRQGTVRRRWSSSCGRCSHDPTVEKRAAPRSHGCCISSEFCPQNTWLIVCQRRHTSWHHLHGLVKCKSETSFGWLVLYRKGK